MPGDSTGTGDGTSSGTTSHALVLSTGQSIVGGDRHTCALLEGGAVKCWGSNVWGQLGHSTAQAQTQLDPLQNPYTLREEFVNLGTGRTAKAAGRRRFGHVRDSDTDQLKCWGANDVGQLGQGGTVPRGLDDSVFEDMTTHINGGMGDALAPINLGTGRTAKWVAVGAMHTCVVLDTNQVKCWGKGEPGSSATATD